jgi:hypothetical protein
MANDAAEADPEKMQADVDKMSKEIEAMNAEADDICKLIQANAKLKDNIEKVLKKI